LRKAVAFSQFSELKRQESVCGFSERPTRSVGLFFRKGQAGAWREELPDSLAKKLLLTHVVTMRRFGYGAQIEIEGGMHGD
jgi:hypothetical protein